MITCPQCKAPRSFYYVGTYTFNLDTYDNYAWNLYRCCKCGYSEQYENNMIGVIQVGVNYVTMG